VKGRTNKIDQQGDSNMRLVVSVLFIIAIVGVGLSNIATAEPAERVTEQPLGKLPQGILALKVSPDGRHIALVARKGNMFFIVVDGQAGPEHDNIAKGCPLFSPDSRRMAYVANKGKKWSVIVDGQAGPGYDAIVNGTPLFSPDGNRVTYAAMKGEKWVIVDNGLSSTMVRPVRSMM
jgi:hypothetical protein